MLLEIMSWITEEDWREVSTLAGFWYGLFEFILNIDIILSAIYPLKVLTYNGSFNNSDYFIYLCYL